MTFVTLVFILGGLLLLFSAIEDKPIADYAKALISTGKVPTK
jgi:hypothetical protein